VDAEKHYFDRLREFRGEEVEPGGIVLLGSSHFEWFPTDRHLPGYRIVNRGIASDRLGIGDRGILHRLDISAFDCQPAFVVFNNGVNDLGELWREGEPPLDAIFAAYERVVGALRQGLPQTPILIINELPTCGRFAGLNPLVRQLNPVTERTAARFDCRHLDVHSAVVSETGELPVELTWDGLHLNDDGYSILATSIKRFLPPAGSP
jgi:lysophospholipase L1-like esterase